MQFPLDIALSSSQSLILPASQVINIIESYRCGFWLGVFPNFDRSIFIILGISWQFLKQNWHVLPIMLIVRVKSSDI